MRLPRWTLVAAAAAEEACRFTIPIQVDGSREVHYAAYDESRSAEDAAHAFCATVGALGGDCVAVVAGHVARRAKWQCGGAHPHAPLSPVAHEQLGPVDYEHPPPRFDAAGALDDGVAYFHEHGYAVFAGVAGGGEVAAIKSKLWDFFEERFGVRRDDVATWDLLPANEYGIMLQYGVGQSDALWRLRLNPNVSRVFAAVWRDDDLLTDFGGAVAFRPVRCTARWRTPERWYHVDMNAATYDGFESVQGFLALSDNAAETGGLVVIPGSRRFHRDVSARAAQWWGVHDPDHQFLLARPDDPALLGAAPKFVACAAGDLVLWDSRLLHASTNARVPHRGGARDAGRVWFDDDATATPGDRTKRALKRLASIAGFGHFPIDASCLNDTAPELQRLVALVSMAPRSKAPEDVLVKRRGAYVGEQTTSHWPFRFDADAPTEKPTRRDADLTPAMRRLIG